MAATMTYPFQQESAGELWPQEPALTRYRTYRHYERIFSGDHEELWDPQRDPDDAPYVTVNVSAALTQTIVDRLWGSPPKPGVAQDEQVETVGEDGLPIAQEEDPRAAMLKDIWEASQLDTEGKLAVETRSWAGDGVLKAFYDAAANAVRVTIVDPESFDATFDPLDAARMTEAVFSTVIPNPLDNAHDWLFEEAHTLVTDEDGTQSGLIENRLYELSATAYTGHMQADQRLRRRVPWEKRPDILAPLEEFVETGIDVLPVVLIPNRKTARTRPWGRSDYCETEAIQRQLNRRYTETNAILDKHEDLILYGDISLFDREGEGMEFNYYRNRAIPLQQGEDPPGYIPYPGTTAEGQAEADTLKRDFARVSRVNPESMGLIDGGLPPSGRAIKLMQVNTTSTVDGHRLVIDPLLRAVLSAATKLHAAWVQGAEGVESVGWLEPDEIHLEWSDGLPEDMLESVQLASQAALSGLPLQKWRLVQIVFPEMTQEECEAEVAASEAESQAAMEASFGAAQEAAGGSTDIGGGDLEGAVNEQGG
jgi:hypothetical protein